MRVSTTRVELPQVSFPIVPVGRPLCSERRTESAGWKPAVRTGKDAGRKPALRFALRARSIACALSGRKLTYWLTDNSRASERFVEVQDRAGEVGPGCELGGVEAGRRGGVTDFAERGGGVEILAVFGELLGEQGLQGFGFIGARGALEGLLVGPGEAGGGRFFGGLLEDAGGEGARGFHVARVVEEGEGLLRDV